MVLLLCLARPGPFALAGEADTNRVRLLTAHVDIAVVYQPADETNKLAIMVNDDDAGRTYRSNEVALVATEAARLTLPGGTLFGEEGAPFWVLPQSLNPDVLFLGLSGEAAPASSFVGALELRLTALQGPGQFFVWQAGGFGEFDLRVSSADGLSESDGVPVLPGSHGHFNWGFTSNGVYELTFQAFGRRAGVDTNDFSLPTTLRFEVEPLPPEPERPFARWQKEQWPGVTDPAVIGPGADPDGDGVVNAVEYALGMDPKVPGRAGLPTAVAERSGVEQRALARFATPKSATDVQFRCWRARTLPSGNWESVPGPLAVGGADLGDRVALQFDAGAINDLEPMFLRFEVELLTAE